MFFFQFYSLIVLTSSFLVDDSFLICEDLKAIDFSKSCISSQTSSECKENLEKLKNYIKFRDYYIRLYIDDQLKIFHSKDGFIFTTSCKITNKFKVIEIPKSCNEDIEISIQNADGTEESAFLTRDSIIRKKSNIIPCAALKTLTISLVKSAKQIIRKNNFVKLISSNVSFKAFETISESSRGSLVGFYDDYLENNVVYEFCRDFFNFFVTLVIFVFIFTKKKVKNSLLEKIRFFYSIISKQTTREIETKASELEEVKIGKENEEPQQFLYQSGRELYEIYESQTCVALKKLLRENSLSQAGAKTDLIERLVKHLIKTQDKNVFTSAQYSSAQ